MFKEFMIIARENVVHGTNWHVTGIIVDLAGHVHIRFSDGRCFDRYYNTYMDYTYCA